MTFVVQGAIGANTAQNLESIRFFYPHSKIILSTWSDQVVRGLQYDQILLNDDPGPIDTIQNLGMNTNRMIVSTINGLKQVQTPRAIKTRTDLGFSKNYTNFFSTEAGQYFDRKIIALNLFFRNPLKSNKLFHIGDLFMAGLTSDLQKLWDVPLVSDFKIKSSLKERVFNKLPVRLTAEQHLWLSFLTKNNEGVYLDYIEDVDIKRFIQSETSMACNFELKTAEELGLLIPARLIENGESESVYSQSDFDRILIEGSDIVKAKKKFNKQARKAVLRFLSTPMSWI